MSEDAVIAVAFLMPTPVGVVQRTLEVLTNVEASHSTAPIDPTTAAPGTPKLVPTMVAVAEPAVGPFSSARNVTAGASYEKIKALVPVNVRTTTPTSSALPEPTAGTHVADVVLTHSDLLQETPPMLTSTFRSLTPKFVPETVVVVPAVVGPFALAISVMTGPSYVNPNAEPDWPRNVTDVANPVPAPAGTAHRSAVSEIQSTAVQVVPANLIVGVGSDEPKLKPWTVTVAPADNGALPG